VNKKNVKSYLGIGVIVLLFTYAVGTVYMTIAAFNYLIILAGFLLRKVNRRIHVTLLSLGILFDLSLVLLLEFQRDAIATAVSLKLSPLNQAHIYFSSLATLLYIPMVITGIMILKKERCRIWHRRLGYGTIFFRTLGFLLMFSMLTTKN
jgi:hypothetical protein